MARTEKETKDRRPGSGAVRNEGFDSFHGGFHASSAVGRSRVRPRLRVGARPVPVRGIVGDKGAQEPRDGSGRASEGVR